MMAKRFSRHWAAAVFMILLTGGVAMAEDGFVRVSQEEALKAVREKIQPVYPQMAKQLHLQGVVTLEARISESGGVGDVKALTGNPVLMNAAVAAMKRWKFTPFSADGKPAKAIADISFDFKL
jgi:TonB family protein